MIKYLLKYKDDFIDIMNINGACLLSQYQLDKFNKAIVEIKELDKKIVLSIGSRTSEITEKHGFHNVNGLDDKYTIIELSEEELKIMDKILPIGFAEHFYDKIAFHNEYYHEL